MVQWAITCILLWPTQGLAFLSFIFPLPPPTPHLSPQQPSCAGPWGPLVAETCNCLNIAVSPRLLRLLNRQRGGPRWEYWLYQAAPSLCLVLFTTPFTPPQMLPLTFVQLPLIKLLPLSLLSFFFFLSLSYPILFHLRAPPKCVLADKLNNNTMLHCPIC